MTFPPDIPLAVVEQMQRMHDQAHARRTMNAAVEHTLDYARRRADHRAELWKPDNRAPYTLEPFIHYVLHTSQLDAEARLFGMFATPPTKPVHVAIAVPDWVNTCRGHGAPELEEPTWVRVWENIEPGVSPVHFPKTENAIALAAYGRRPSLVRADWDWVGIYPFGTMAYDPPPLVEFHERHGTIEGDAEAEGQAAA